MSLTSLIRTIRESDEAKPTVLEVVLAYPGFHIMTIFHPVAACLWRLGLRGLARFWAYIGSIVTGIEIHPAATIGKNIFIDHGRGVVIGQTAVIGDHCRLYQGVTLGGKGQTINGRRHPVLEEHVIVGAGAQVLGPITIGRQAKIGASAVVTKDVPPDFTAVGNPARLVGKLQPSHAAYGLPDGEMPDPIAHQIHEIEIQLEDVKSEKIEK